MTTIALPFFTKNDKAEASSRLTPAIQQPADWLLRDIQGQRAVLQARLFTKPHNYEIIDPNAIATASSQYMQVIAEFNTRTGKTLTGNIARLIHTARQITAAIHESRIEEYYDDDYFDALELND